jgi:beta-galactosidase GanA
MILSGGVHRYRYVVAHLEEDSTLERPFSNRVFSLPVASLYIDIFEKVKPLGFNCVSFYVDWALLEGNPGHYSAEGMFDLQPFLEAANAAKEAGIYLLARPGPYINAEVSGGGFPGWLQRVNGTLRTSNAAYLESTDKYGDCTADGEWEQCLEY